MVDTVVKTIQTRRSILFQEMQERAGDDVIFKRRFRMLSQLADYESQIIKKIYQFSGNSVDDYVLAAKAIVSEIYDVTDRSG